MYLRKGAFKEDAIPVKKPIDEGSEQQGAQDTWMVLFITHYLGGHWQNSVPDRGVDQLIAGVSN